MELSCYTDAPAAAGGSSPQKKGPSRFQNTSSCTPAKDFRNKQSLAKKPWEESVSFTSFKNVYVELIFIS